MKFLILLVIAVYAVDAGKLTDEQRHKLLDIHNACVKETGVDEELTAAAMTGDFSDDPKFIAQVICFNKKIGFMDDAGHILTDKIKEKFSMFFDDMDKLDGAIAKCAVEKGTPEETALEMAKCFHNEKKDL